MAKTTKAAGSKSNKTIADVAHPGTSSPSDTSKSIITPRPIMKDPMVVEEGIDKSKDTAKKELAKKTSEVKIMPLGEEPAEDKEDNAAAPEPDEKTDTEAKPDAEMADKPETKEDESNTDDKGDDKSEEDETDSKDEAADKKSKKSDTDAEESAAQAEQDAKLQKVIDSKKYFLPINAVEQRRSKRFVALGIFLALVLAVAWVDVALDASLIHLGNVKPVTHLFSN